MPIIFIIIFCCLLTACKKPEDSQVAFEALKENTGFVVVESTSYSEAADCPGGKGVRMRFTPVTGSSQGEFGARICQTLTRQRDVEEKNEKASLTPANFSLNESFADTPEAFCQGWPESTPFPIAYSYYMRGGSFFNYDKSKDKSVKNLTCSPTKMAKVRAINIVGHKALDSEEIINVDAQISRFFPDVREIRFEAFDIPNPEAFSFGEFVKIVVIRPQDFTYFEQMQSFLNAIAPNMKQVEYLIIDAFKSRSNMPALNFNFVKDMPNLYGVFSTIKPESLLPFGGMASLNLLEFSSEPTIMGGEIDLPNLKLFRYELDQGSNVNRLDSLDVDVESYRFER